MSHKWSEARERGIRQKTLRTLCRLHVQLAGHGDFGLAEPIKQMTGMSDRTARDYAKTLVLIRRTQVLDELRAKYPALRTKHTAQEATSPTSMDDRTFKRWLRFFSTELKYMLDEAFAVSKESQKKLESIPGKPTIDFDNLTDMPFMKRAHIYVMSLTCPYGKKEVSYVPCPYERFEEELAGVCDNCPRKKYELPLSEWAAKVRMTVPSDDLPRFLSGLTKEIKNVLDDMNQAVP